MTKLNQIIALAPGRKTQAQKAMTEAYHKFQKDDLLFGVSRTYRPKNEDGDMFPPEKKSVQVKVAKTLEQLCQSFTDMVDAVATLDTGNTMASANIVVNGKTIAENVPVTLLLFLEKQAEDLVTLAQKLPVLDPAEQWSYDSSTDCYVSEATETNKTKKVPQKFIKYEATKEHPAQVDVWQEDIVVGTWSTRKFSGAVTAQDKNEAIANAVALKEAIKSAREEANSVTVTSRKIGEKLYLHVFGQIID